MQLLLCDQKETVGIMPRIVIFRQVVLELNCECKCVYIYSRVTRYRIHHKMLTRPLNEYTYISFFLDVFPSILLYNMD